MITDSRCRADTCRARIVWAWTDTTYQTRIPIDAAASPFGNVRLTNAHADHPDRDPAWIAEVLGPLEVELSHVNGEMLYTAHFVACPEADRWRKKKR